MRDGRCDQDPLWLCLHFGENLFCEIEWREYIHHEASLVLTTLRFIGTSLIEDSSVVDHAVELTKFAIRTEICKDLFGEALNRIKVRQIIAISFNLQIFASSCFCDHFLSIFKPLLIPSMDTNNSLSAISWRILCQEPRC